MAAYQQLYHTGELKTRDEKAKSIRQECRLCPGYCEVNRLAGINLASVKVMVYGQVQGVSFRAFTSRQAAELGLTGHVRNLPDGKAVEVKAEGERDKLEKLIGHLKVGPSGVRVERVESDWSEYTGGYSDFSIRY